MKDRVYFYVFIKQKGRIILYMFYCICLTASPSKFPQRSTYTDDEDVVATQRWLLVASL